MATTVNTHQSLGSRLGDSIRGILTGLALFVLAFPVLFWNEGRTVHRAKALSAGETACVESGLAPDAALDGRLVHVVGEAASDETLSDPLFPVSVAGIRLRRSVEMFQWEESSRSETKTNLGGSTDTKTTYSYSKGWSKHAIDSSGFAEKGHDNPQMPIEEEEVQASRVRLGGFELSGSLIHRIGGERPLPLAAGTVADWTPPFPAHAAVIGGVLYLRPGAADATGTNIVAAAGTNAVVSAPAPDFITAPQVGDLRVSFHLATNHVVSVVAGQSGAQLGVFQTKNGPVELLAEGGKSAEAMFAAAKSANRTIAWLIRLGGFLLMFVGVRLVLGPLTVLADVIPFLGRIVGVGTGIVAFLVALPCSLVTIAIAWIAYRPALGIGLLVAAGVAGVLLYRRAAARR